MIVSSMVVKDNNNVYISPYGQFTYKEKQLCIVKMKYRKLTRKVRMNFYVIRSA